MLAAAKTPVYLAVGEDDSYYGSGPLKSTYAQLRELYEQQGLAQDEIDRLVVLDVKPGSYFTERGFRDQHAGGQAFAHDEEIMGWLLDPTASEPSRRNWNTSRRATPAPQSTRGHWKSWNTRRGNPSPMTATLSG